MAGWQVKARKKGERGNDVVPACEVPTGWHENEVETYRGARSHTVGWPVCYRRVRVKARPRCSSSRRTWRPHDHGRGWIRSHRAQLKARKQLVRKKARAQEEYFNYAAARAKWTNLNVMSLWESTAMPAATKEKTPEKAALLGVIRW